MSETVKQDTLIAELKQKPIWLVWKNKQPFSVVTGKATGTSPEHKKEWVNYLEVKSCFDNHILTTHEQTAGASDSLVPEGGWDGIGFVIPKGYFFIDVDHADVLSPTVQELLDLFDGCYVEISPSGNGLHIYGRCDVKALPNDYSMKFS